MIGWGRAKRDWQRRSRHEQVETSSRWMLYVSPWAFWLGGLPALFTQDGVTTASLALTAALLALGLMQSVLCVRGIEQALDFYLGTGPLPRNWIVALGAMLCVLTGLTTALVAVGTLENPVGPGMALFGAVAPFAAVYGLTVPKMRAMYVLGGVCLLAAAAVAAVGTGWAESVVALAAMAFSAMVNALTPRSSGWYIAVMRELNAAREAQAELAVAEERLRFSRDLHDVMGRNLSVIALKSELAVQLAQRGSDAAVDQMTEVQRLARESQTEVREVVRGYREAGLRTELAGARGVLRAAGVDCRIEGDALPDGGPGGDAGVPRPAQAALGWVVREGATNVLRHADASYCTVRVEVEPAAVRLVMENDGASSGDVTRGGSGLAGLRERLAALGGTLTARGEAATGTFRLCAEVPVERASGDRNGADGEETEESRERRAAQER